MKASKKVRLKKVTVEFILRTCINVSKERRNHQKSATSDKKKERTVPDHWRRKAPKEKKKVEKTGQAAKRLKKGLM